MLGVLCVAPDALFVRLIEADTLTIAFWRSLLTGGIIFIGLLMIYRGQTFAKIHQTGRYGLIYATFAGGSSIMFVTAIQKTSVANAVFIIAAMPIFAALYSRLFLNERLSPRMIWTISLVVLGLSVIAYGSSESENAHWHGDLLALGTAACFAAALTAARKAKAVSMVPAIPVAYIGAAVLIWPFTNPLSVPSSQWGLVFLHGGVFIVISTALLSLGPRYITSAEVALLILLESILAPLLVWTFIGENPGAWALIGGAIVIGVLFVSNMVALTRRRKTMTK